MTGKRAKPDSGKKALGGRSKPRSNASSLPSGNSGASKEPASKPSENRGVRRDGKFYKNGNTRADGSYKVGDRRTPEDTRFRKDDGRERGRRPKGRKNLLTEWREELDTKVAVTENGKHKMISKRRMLIKSKIKRGIENSDRAAETALRYDEMSERRDPGLQADDYEIIDAWLKGILQNEDSDDADITEDNEGDGDDQEPS